MRLSAVVTLVCCATLCGAGSPGDDKERERLQGTWHATTVVSDGNSMKSEGIEFVFEDEVLSFRRDGRPLPMRWRVEVTSGSSPKHIDGIPLGDSGAPPNTVIPCIYKLEDDTLTLCIPQGDLQTMRRPVDFDSKKGSKIGLFVLKRPTP